MWPTVLSRAKDTAPFFSEAEFRLAALDLFSRRGIQESRDWSDTTLRTGNASVTVSPPRKHSELSTQISLHQEKGAFSFARDSTPAGGPTGEAEQVKHGVAKRKNAFGNAPKLQTRRLGAVS